jgi:hypothetical protein
MAMRCRDCDLFLATGAALTAEIAEHLRTCPRCSQLAKVGPASVATSKPAFLLPADLKAVSPMDSSVRLKIKLALGFLLTCGLGMILLSGDGWMAMSVLQKFWLGVGLLSAAILLVDVAPRMIIPASRFWSSPRWIVLLALSLLLSTVVLAFQWNLPENTLRNGIRCFVSIMAFSIPCAVASAWIVRSGWLTDGFLAGLIVGALAGISGMIAIQWHCTILEVGHTLSAHLGSVVAVSVIGGLIGNWQMRRQESIRKLS